MPHTPHSTHQRQSVGATKWVVADHQGIAVDGYVVLADAFHCDIQILFVVTFEKFMNKV